MKLLLRSKAGLTVVELAERLHITSNAVRQHLATLENEGLVAPGALRPSGGRPEQLYQLTEAGKELFPRHYAWFAQLVVESIRQECGEAATRERLGRMGTGVARQLLAQQPEMEDPQRRVDKLAGIMGELGYETRQPEAEGGDPVIEADNCIFHSLAMSDPDVCEFDLALLSTFTGSAVDHQECMAKGGNVCRFRFTPKK